MSGDSRIGGPPPPPPVPLPDNVPRADPSVPKTGPHHRAPLGVHPHPVGIHPGHHLRRGAIAKGSAKRKERVTAEDGVDEESNDEIFGNAETPDLALRPTAPEDSGQHGANHDNLAQVEQEVVALMEEIVANLAELENQPVATPAAVQPSACRRRPRYCFFKVLKARVEQVVRSAR